MEGVGARLGRSSTRYGPATVFTGPVRKWKKKWIHVTPPNSAAASSNDKQHHHHQQQQHQSNGNSSSSNGNNVDASHILLYKWTPISQSHNSSSANDNSNGDAKEDTGAVEVDEEPPRRKMKYIPVAVLEEQNNEAAEAQTDEPKPTETNPHTASEPSLKDEKPDINDVPIEENQEVSENMEVEREDVKKSNSCSSGGVGLSLNLNASDGDQESEEA
ncbi:hypothetical protein Ccrd_024438, partial [Cynara cardunculus var. scolymus]